MTKLEEAAEKVRQAQAAYDDIASEGERLVGERKALEARWENWDARRSTALREVGAAQTGLAKAAGMTISLPELVYEEAKLEMAKSLSLSYAGRLGLLNQAAPKPGRSDDDEDAES